MNKIDFQVHIEGKEAVGLWCRVGDVDKYVRVKKEVILCAGAVCTPQVKTVCFDKTRFQ